MRFGKKVITWLMALTMVFGLLPAQVMADDTTTTPSVTLEYDATEDGNFVAGDTVKVNIVYNADAAVDLTGIQMFMEYDETLLSVKTYKEYSSEYIFNPTSDTAVEVWNDESSYSADGLISLVLGDDEDVLSVDKDDNAILGYIEFTVLEDVTGTGSISIIENFASSAFVASISSVDEKVNEVYQLDNDKISAIAGVDFSSSVTVNVVEEGIVLSVDGVEEGTTGDGAAYKVTVDGKNDIAITATYYDENGADKTDEVDGWTYENNSLVGVTFADSAITVSAVASAGSYTILAKNGSGTTLASTVLSVSRAPSVADSIAFADGTTTETIYVPSTSTANTADYSVTVKDQFGSTMTPTSYEWSLSPTIAGVTVSTASGGATVTVTNAAAETIADTEGQVIGLTVTCGDVSETQDITIKRADSVLTSIGILKSGTKIESDTIAIPTGDDTTVTYTVVGYDQYGSEMTVDVNDIAFGVADPNNVSTGVTWEKNTGTATATVTVPSSASTGEIEFNATVTGVELPTTIKIFIVDIAFTSVDDSEITVNSATYGMKWEEIVSFDATDWVAKVGDETIIGAYSLKDAEAIPDAGNDVAYTIVFTSDDSRYQGVTAYSAYVTIGDATITGITNTSQTVKYTGSAISITAPTATTVNGEGYTVKYSTDSGSTYESDVLPSYTDAGTYTIYYKISADNHEDETGTITFIIIREGSTTTPTAPTTSTSYTYGDEITLTAAVALDTSANAASVNAVAEKTVEFFVVEDGEDDVSLGTATVTSDGTNATTGAGTATLVYDTYEQGLAIGDNTIKAVYGGSVNLNGSTSDTISVKLVEKDLTDTTMTVSISTATEKYTGEPIAKSIEVKDGETKLSEVADGVGDYTVAYENNTNVGTATITVTGSGYYKGSVEETFTIEQENSVVTTPDDAKSITATYGDTITLKVTVAIAPTPTISSVATISAVDTPEKDTVSFYCGDTLLGSVANVAEGDTVTYSYDTYKNGLSISESNKIDVYYGGSDNLIGASSMEAITVKLAAKSLTSDDISVSGIDTDGYDFTNSAITPTITVTDGDITLVEVEDGVGDYTVAYSNNENAGTATITITGSGNYGDIITKNFIIKRADATATPDTGDSGSGGDDSTGDDSTVVPDFTETYGEEITLSVTIGAKADDVAVASVSAVGDDLTENTVGFYYGETCLGTDTVAASGGVASITFNPIEKEVDFAIGNNSVDVYYGGSTNLNGGLVATLTVAVEAKSLKHTDISVDDITAQNYTGSAITQDGLTVEDDGTKLTKDEHYTVTYENNINAGTDTAKITITGIGNYKDSITKYFTINQIVYTGTTEQTSKAKYGNTGTLDLSNVWGIDGLEVTYTDKTDNNGIISGTPSIADNVLSYTLVDDSTKVDKTATITVSVASTNYTTFTGTIVVTLLNKDIPIISVENIVKTYNGKAITLDDIDAKTEVTGTWSFKDDSTEFKDVNDSGSCTLVFTPDDEYLADYIVEEKDITVTINPATITITADDVRAYRGSDEPVSYDYSVDGLVSGESLTRTPTLTCTPDMETNGTYPILVGTDATASANYTIVYVNGTLTVYTTSKTSSYYIKVTVTGNGTVDPDGGADHMYEVKKGADAEFEFDADSGYEITDVIVDGSSVGVCDEYTFENVYAHGTLEVVFEKSSTSDSDDDEDVEDEEDVEDSAVEDESTVYVPFVDTDEDDKYYDAIAYVYENGIMAGISSEVFGSGMSITRGMIAAILYRVDGSNPVDSDMPFDDVDVTQYYAEAIKWAKADGVVAGVSETEFAPDTPITNEQFVVFLYRYANLLGMDMTISAGTDLSDYPNAENISDYAYFAMLWALDKGIISADEALDPTTEALRGDVANALMIFLEM